MPTEHLKQMTNARRAKNAQQTHGEHEKLHIWNSSQMMTWQNPYVSDDDVAEPQKNAETTKKKGKVRVTTKTIHYYEFSGDGEDEAHADPKTNEKTHADHEKSTKKVKMIKHLSPMK